MLDAQCRGMGQEEFFPKRGGGRRKGLKVCEQCSVTAECRDYAERTNTHYGIWGGEVLSREPSDKELGGEVEHQFEPEPPIAAELFVVVPGPAVMAPRGIAAPARTLPEAVGFSKPSLPLLPPD